MFLEATGAGEHHTSITLPCPCLGEVLGPEGSCAHSPKRAEEGGGDHSRITLASPQVVCQAACRSQSLGRFALVSEANKQSFFGAAKANGAAPAADQVPSALPSETWL